MRKERWAKSSGSTIGRGWRRLRATTPPSRHRGGGEGSRGSSRGPAPVVALDDRQRDQRQPERQHQRPGQVGQAAVARAAARAGAGAGERIAAPSGRLTRKTRRQSESSTSAPPSVGPIAAAAAAAAPQRPTPAARRSLGKLSRTSASEVGAIIAAPMPCRTRKAISSSSEGATAQSRLARGEAGDAEQEDALVAEAVGEAPGRHQQRGDDDEVAVEHPGERVPPRPGEGGRDVREGDVDDRRVEEGEEGAGTGDGDASLL